MIPKKLSVALVAVLLLSVVAAPAAAATGSHDGATVDECKNADAGPSGDAGPPSFVGGLVPNFLGDLFANLPVPNFVKSLFGAETC